MDVKFLELVWDVVSVGLVAELVSGLPPNLSLMLSCPPGLRCCVRLLSPVLRVQINEINSMHNVSIRRHEKG